MYVCTAARRPYALEAWRLLDPDGALIPLHRLARRLCNIKTGQKKSMLATLGMRRATQEDLGGTGEGINTRLWYGHAWHAGGAGAFGGGGAGCPCWTSGAQVRGSF